MLHANPKPDRWGHHYLEPLMHWREWHDIPCGYQQLGHELAVS